MLSTKSKYYIAIMVLLVLILILTIVLVSKKKSEGFANSLGSNAVSQMTRAQVQQVQSVPACAVATQQYCQVAAAGPSKVDANVYSAAASNVTAACGQQYPVNAVCAETNPNFQLNPDNFWLGGTHMQMP